MSQDSIALFLKIATELNKQAFLTQSNGLVFLLRLQELRSPRQAQLSADSRSLCECASASGSVAEAISVFAAVKDAAHLLVDDRAPLVCGSPSSGPEE